MAKKSRRARRRARKKRSVAAAKPKRPVSAPSPVVAREIEAPAGDKMAKLAKEYHYVYSDLKRIAILAGAMFAALIALSFVLR